MYRTRMKRGYASDLREEEWKKLEPLIPAISEKATYSRHERRRIVEGILYVLWSGCPWRALPHDFPAWETVYGYFRQWKQEGVWERVLVALRGEAREK